MVMHFPVVKTDGPWDLALDVRGDFVIGCAVSACCGGALRMRSSEPTRIFECSGCSLAVAPGHPGDFLWDGGHAARAEFLAFVEGDEAAADRLEEAAEAAIVVERESWEVEG